MVIIDHGVRAQRPARREIVRPDLFQDIPLEILRPDKAGRALIHRGRDNDLFPIRINPEPPSTRAIRQRDSREKIALEIVHVDLTRQERQKVNPLVRLVDLRVDQGKVFPGTLTNTTGVANKLARPLEKLKRHKVKTIETQIIVRDNRGSHRAPQESLHRIFQRYHLVVRGDHLERKHHLIHDLAHIADDDRIAIDHPPLRDHGLVRPKQVRMIYRSFGTAQHGDHPNK